MVAEILRSKGLNGLDALSAEMRTMAGVEESDCPPGWEPGLVSILVWWLLDF